MARGRKRKERPEIQYTPDPDQLLRMMQDIEATQQAAADKQMSVASQYKMADRAGYHTDVMKICRRLRRMEETKALSWIRAFDAYRPILLQNVEAQGDLFPGASDEETSAAAAAAGEEPKGDKERFYLSMDTSEGGSAHKLMARDAGGTPILSCSDVERIKTAVFDLNQAQAGSARALPPQDVVAITAETLSGMAAVVLWFGDFAAASAAHVAPTTDSPPPAATPAAKGQGGKETQRVLAYYVGYDGAKAGKGIDELVKGKRGEIRARIERGFNDYHEEKDPKYARPAAGAPEAPAEAAEAIEPEEVDESDLEQEAELPVRVAVCTVEGKLMLVDLQDEQPIMDVSGPKTGETWANQINEHYAHRLDSVTRAELVDAAKTLAKGRMLTRPAPAAPEADLRAAV
jgi:hypothetical protein